MPAPGGRFSCHVIAAGPRAGGQIYINLKEMGGAFEDRWFVADEGQRKEMLAVALVAITTGYRVDVFLVSTDAESQINWLYVANP